MSSPLESLEALPDLPLMESSMDLRRKVASVNGLVKSLSKDETTHKNSSTNSLEKHPHEDETSKTEGESNSTEENQEVDPQTTTYIARMVFHQLAIEEENDLHEEEEDYYDDDDASTSQKSKSPERVGDLEEVVEIWKEFRKAPASSLILPDSLFLDEGCIFYLIDRLQDLPAEARPTKIVFASHVDRDAADLLPQLIDLCQSTLADICISSRKRENFLRSEHVNNRVLGRTARMSQLSTLSLERVFLSPIAITGLAQTMVSPHCQLRSLLLTESLIYDTTGLAAALEQYAKLEQLSVSGCELGDEKLLILAEAIEVSPSPMTHLNLSANVLTKSSLPTVANMVNGNKTLEVLNLSRNLLFLGSSEEKAQTLHEALARHPNLQDLRLNCCGLNSWSVKPMFAALNKNPNLLYLQLAAPLGELEAEQNWIDSLERIQKVKSKLITSYWTQVDENTSYLSPTAMVDEQPRDVVPQLGDVDGLLSPNLDLDALRILSRNRLLHQVSIYLGDPKGMAYPKSGVAKFADLLVSTVNQHLGKAITSVQPDALARAIRPREIAQVLAQHPWVSIARSKFEQLALNRQGNESTWV